MSFLAVASVLATLFTLSAAQAQTSEQSAALGTDPVFECTPYSLPAVTALVRHASLPESSRASRTHARGAPEEINRVGRWGGQKLM